MSGFDADEALRGLQDELARPFVPLLRLYLDGVTDDAAGQLPAILPEYRVARNRENQCALVRNVSFASRENFISECARVAGVIGLVANGWRMEAIYDYDYYRTSRYSYEIPDPLG